MRESHLYTLAAAYEILAACSKKSEPDARLLAAPTRQEAAKARAPVEVYAGWRRGPRDA